MSTSRQTHLNQQDGKRSVQKQRRAQMYSDFAVVKRGPSKDELRAAAERALGEWQLKNQPRTSNLSDHLRKKY
jgi:hypothetical protein